MQLANFGVSPKPEIDGSVVVAADYGKQRVICQVRRVDLDDYFQSTWPDLDDTDRRMLVEGNEGIFIAHVQKKCDAGDWRDEGRFGSTVKRVEISLNELRGGPRLSDARLQIAKNAGFRRPA